MRVVLLRRLGSVGSGGRSLEPLCAGVDGMLALAFLGRVLGSKVS